MAISLITNVYAWIVTALVFLALFIVTRFIYDLKIHL